MDLRHGDCVEVMRGMEPDSVDAIVCDPPYGLEFMGKDFDKLGHGEAQQKWHLEWTREAYRVLKPGGHLLAFGGTRTYHRLACAVEDAGFEVRDQIQWLYGSGFPKSLAVGRAIDKAAGAEREVVGSHTKAGDITGGRLHSGSNEKGVVTEIKHTIPATDEAKEWEGWGTALKPANEPICVGRKPLIGTVAENVQAFGTGALNIDGCRIETGEIIKTIQGQSNAQQSGKMYSGKDQRNKKIFENNKGRWPANVILTHAPDCEPVGVKKVKGGSGWTGKDQGKPGALGQKAGWNSHKNKEADVFAKYGDENGLETVESWNCVEGCPVAELDRQSGVLKSGNPTGVKRGVSARERNEELQNSPNDFSLSGFGDTGTASRFFYVAKASSAERSAGLGESEFETVDDGRNTPIDNPYLRGETMRQNFHPTVKPVMLMRYLVRLVTPPKGTVLDCFMGSGTTGIACHEESFNFIGIEKDDKYFELAERRINENTRQQRLF